MFLLNDKLLQCANVEALIAVVTAQNWPKE
jgi:hypothetical protein